MTLRSLTAALMLAALAAPASAQISNNPKVLAPFKTVVEKSKDSTVRVRADDRDIALGTVVFTDGFILTKASELRQGRLWVRLSDGSEYEAQIVGKHRETDLAMLKVEAKGLKAVSFADGKKTLIGNWLAATGPTSDAVAIGIVSAGVRKLIEYPEIEIVNHNRGMIGIRLDTSDAKGDDGTLLGAKIVEVTKGGAGEKAGLKIKDVVAAVEQFKVPSRAALQEAMENFRPGDSVTLTVLREGAEQSLKLKLTEVPTDPKDRGRIQNAMGGELSGRRTGFPAVLQTDMVVEPKNCGGPIVDLDGNVLGISIARAGRVETWILPSEHILPLLKELKDGKFSLPTAVKDVKPVVKEVKPSK